MSLVYFVRYGLMRHVGAFASEGGPAERGQAVVVRSARGTEVGEVVAPAPETARPGAARIVRAAGPEDLARWRSVGAEASGRRAACEELFGRGTWPLTVLDVEALLDDRRTVVYYLGPHGLDAAGLRQAVREAIDLDIVLEPVGRDEPAEPAGCGAEGCGGGGCGSHSADGTAHACDGCAVKDLVRRRPASGG